jgi:hypothetical protein
MGYRWRGFEHPKLYEMINAGPGAAASDPQTTYWQGLSEELAAVDEDLNTSLNNLGARWEGKAAESATSGLTPLAAWAGDAETGSRVMKISTENQGEYISDARARMPEPVEVTTQSPSGWAMAAAGAAMLTGNAGPAVQVAAQAADHEAQEAAQSEAEQRAVETMQTYESSSTWNRETLGTFVAPPDVVVSTPPPQGGGTASAVLINAEQTYTPTGDTGGPTNNTGNPQFIGGLPSNGDPGSGGGGAGGGGGTGGSGGSGGGSGSGSGSGSGVGGGVGTPGSVPAPGTTPSDVFVPPPGQPGPGPFPGPGPTPGPGPNPNPYLPGAGPYLPGAGDGNTANNAGDVARRAVTPLRPGLPMPGMPGEPFGPGRGPGGGPGGFGGLGGPGGLPGGIDGERSPSQLGRGGVLGGAPGEGGVVRNGPGAAGAAGARGGGVNGPMGAGGRRAEGEDDDEHFAPDYLLETDDVFGDERRVSPTVIGEQ